MRAVYWIFLAIIACTLASKDKKIVCYFATWVLRGTGDDKFEVSDLDPNLCTHLMYAFVGIEPNGTIRILDPYVDLPSSEPGGGLDGYTKFNKLRDRNPNLKTMISVGGWGEGSVNYSLMISTAETRRTFVRDAVNFVKKYDFNGLDFDWEYPNQRGGVETDKRNFVLLLKELREEFDKEGFLLSAAVGSIKSLASPSYIIPKVSKYLDFINLMTYDIHNLLGNKTGYNAPLYPGCKDDEEERELNVLAAVKYWLKEGAEPKKIILGMPLYGHAFTLLDPKNTSIGSPAIAGSGPYLKEADTLCYCENQLKKNWKILYDEEKQVPYAIRDDLWVSYDNPRSLEQKVKLLKRHKLGGAMVWSIENDDVRGVCGRKYPLMTTIKNTINAD